MGKKRPGFTLGTAMYEALAAKIANKNRLPVSWVINELSIATRLPLIIGINIAKIIEKNQKRKKFLAFGHLLFPCLKGK